MSTAFDSGKFIEKEFGMLVGAKIVGVRALTASEIEDIGWDDRGSAVPFTILLDNGRALIPSMDAEGNGAGHLFLEEWK